MCFNHNISPNYKRINERIPSNPQKLNNAKIKNEKRENIMRKSSDNYIKLNETKFNDNNNILSNTYFGNMMKNKISRANRVKNNESFFGSKLSTVDNYSIGIIKSKNSKNRIYIPKDIAPTKKMLIKSYFMKDIFGF